MGLRHTLLQERSALEDRLRHVNQLIQNERPPIGAFANQTLAASPVDAFADAIGIDSSTFRLISLLVLLFLIWAHGRSIVHGVSVLTLSCMITSWAMVRRFLRWA
ncbi:MAG: hypothetical protein SGPRY_003281, partial [Prymnesium sp.]